MKKSFYPYLFAIALPFVTAGCDVDQVQEGEMPTVDVDVDGDSGQLPAFDVEGPNVDVSSDRTSVKVPKLDVEMKEKTITTPEIDIDIPNE